VKTQGKKPGKGRAAIELFSTSSGIRAVDSPTRVRILALLKDREMSFDDIVEALGKVKSTVSVHLKTLADEGIVGSRTDPDDARKKIFFINSEYLGGLSRRQRLEKDMEDYVKKYLASSDDPFAFFRFMFRTIRVSLLNEGIDIDPVLHDAGVKVGEALYRDIGGGDLDELLKRLSEFWTAHALGRVEAEIGDSLVLYVRDCFECQDLPYLGKPSCAFDSGVLQAVFSRHYGEAMDVIETNCYTMGDDYCRFVIEKKN
jgi:predicted hydrocarbon binding protein